MNYPVIRGEGYTLAHGACLLPVFSGSIREQRHIKLDLDELNDLTGSLRSYDQVIAYPPNQVYIGELDPLQLRKIPSPWYDNLMEGMDRFGSFGEIMPEDEFIALIKTNDVFDLIRLNKDFTARMKKKMITHPLIYQKRLDRMKDGEDQESIDYLIREQQALPIDLDGKRIGCVKRGHEFDPNLSPYVIMENLTTKASSVLTCLNLLDRNAIDPDEIDYVIECSESAAGDLSQRGGGSFAKAVAEAIGANNATGSDTRAFCAAPAHAIMEAAALVQSKMYRNVLVTAGGSLTKLGMNYRDHVQNKIPVLEDVVAGFAVLISENDGINPIIRTDLVGRHLVSTGSSPQAVITSLVTAPLDRAGLNITDVDRYSVEMQNPDITRSAGAGDVPEANYKMIAALGIKREELEPRMLAMFGEQYGFPGWAPTQGHIPSGIPYIGHARRSFLNHEINRVMIVGKGSLFLARLTNQFDGISLILEKNMGVVDQGGERTMAEDEMKQVIASVMRDFAKQLISEKDS